MRAQLGKFALAKMGKALKQFFAGDERQHGIAQELQLFVVADLVFALARLLRFLFAGLRTMGDRLLHHRAPAEMVVQGRFQRGDFPFFHAESNPGRALKSTSSSEVGSLPFREKRCTLCKLALPESTEGVFTQSCEASLSREPYFGAGVVPGAVPLLIWVRRSFSSRAAFPTFVSALVRSTAWLADFSASVYFFCWSRASESRNTATGSTCCGNASMDFRRSVSASAQALALYSIVPITEYASDR